MNDVLPRDTTAQLIPRSGPEGVGTDSTSAFPAVAEALESWRARLAQAGIACRAVALHGESPVWTIDFDQASPTLAAAWAAAWPQVGAAQPLRVSRVSDDANGDTLVAALVPGNDSPALVAGIALAPPFTNRTLQTLLLTLGALGLALAALREDRSQPATRLLELLGHVASQPSAHAAAQEWVNRTAAWVRDELGSDPHKFGLTLFEVRGEHPRWWVSADTAWVESGSPDLQREQELAVRACVEQQEVRLSDAWALPLMDRGEVVGVLVAKLDTAASAARALPALRASASLAEPLLRHWRDAGRSLPRHAVDAVRDAWARLRGPGHLTWKLGAAATALAAVALLLVPVPDRVTASLVIEGQVRQIVTAPFDGFLAQALVRPGERVAAGQPLARLDDRDLRLEQLRHASERDQAAGKLRQAMAERDAAAMALASAEVGQAEAQLALVNARLARATLLAPMTGLVVTGDWTQQVGGPVETGKEMFEIASTESYRVVLHVPDRDIARVRAGQSGALRLTGQPERSIPFAVTTVTAIASVHEGINGFRVEAAWQGEAPHVSPGMQGVGKVEVGQANLLTIWTRSSVDWLRLKLWAWGW